MGVRSLLIDGVVVFSKSRQDHLSHIYQVLTALGKAGLTANPDKCEWGGRRLLYLGRKISILRVRAMSTPGPRKDSIPSWAL